MSGSQFARQLGLGRYETAFQILHKLRAAMVRPNVDRIGGEHVIVELDESLVGGATRGEGRGVHHQIYVAGAVESLLRVPGAEGKTVAKSKMRRDGRYAGRLRLRALPDRTAPSLVGFARDSISQGSDVRTDGFPGYAQLDLECGVRHHPIAERGDPAVAEAHLPLIHLVFSNLKAWLLGTHHGVSPKHLQAYLNEYVFRFNRRYYPFNGFRSLLGIGACTEAPTYDDLYSDKCVHPVAVGPWELTG